MNTLDLYYHLRPYIPRPVQIAFRRRIAQSKRASVTHCWPILESAGAKPPGWQGWPNGKQFALVLTHDVETQAGHDKCRQLMDLEERLGFRSAFNIVPERYRVSPELRQEMTARGFEVGVHGLYHDGHLFKSRHIFEKRLPKINRYLKDWNAVGFRSPSTRRNLKWIGEFDIAYDSSTFDTDPFEPESDGTGTIFPFLVNDNAGGRPYVELPYTLPQDSTLFIILGEDSPRIWKDKLDWIANHGGMALINTHPDYMDFNGSGARQPATYPVTLYIQFLTYAQSRYGSQFWHALPRDLVSDTTWIQTLRVRKRRLRIGLMGYSFYESDNRKQRAAKALVRRGDHVDAVGLRQAGQTQRTVMEGVHVHRIQLRRRNERNNWAFAGKLFLFFVRSSLFIARQHLRKPYDVVIVNAVPDFEVFAAWLPKLFGSKVVLDIYDVSPEFYRSKFRNDGTARVMFWYRILLLLERYACRFADHVIAANEIWGVMLKQRCGLEGKCSVFCNYLDPAVFYRHPRTRDDDRLLMVYPGNLNYHQGVDIAITAFAKVRQRFPKAEFHIYGDGPELPWLMGIATELGVNAAVQFKPVVPLADIPQIMADADLGLVAKRADIFGNEAYSTKILEYMSQGLPVVAPRTKIDEHYFNDSVVRFFEPGNPEAMAAAMLDILSKPELREQQVRNAFDYVDQADDWEHKKHELLHILDNLVGPPQADK